MPYKDPEKQREYARKWIAARRAEWLADKFCVVCGSTEELEVDHIDRATKVDHKVWSWSSARREAELAKCQVLCKSCHLKKTVEEGPHAQHGTMSMYHKYGCRCEPCREARSEYRRELKSRRSPHVHDL